MTDAQDLKPGRGTKSPSHRRTTGPATGARRSRRPAAGSVARWAIAIVVLAVAIRWPLDNGRFGLHIGSIVAVYALAVIGVDLIVGRAGMLQLGYGVFFGVGAYTVGVVAKHSDLPAGVGVLLAVLVATALAAVLGSAVVGVSGYLFALVTLAASAALEALAGATSTFGGTAGLAGVDRDLFGMGTLDAQQLYLVLVGLALLATALYWPVRRSRTGRALEALRLAPHVAEASGIDTRRLRFKVWIVSGAIGGLAGGLYAVTVQFVSPDVLGVQTSVSFLVMNVVGGAGTAWGGIPGAALMRGLVQGVQGLGDYQLVIAGGAMVAVVAWFPRGIAGTTEAWSRRLARPSSRGQGHAAATGDHGAGVFSIPDVVAPRLRVDRLVVRFGGVHAIDGLSMTIEPGRVTALVGPNGSGKTTFVNAVVGRVPVTSGSIEVGEHDVTRADRRARMHLGVTRTFQLVSLCETLTVRENVMLGGHTEGTAGLLRAALPGGDSKEEAAIGAHAELVLESLGISHLAGESTANLAAGPRRLVEIGRCLMTSASIVLLDEPASGLNAAECEHLAAVITELARSGRGVLLIEHDMRFVMGIADWIVVLRNGMKLAEGMPAAIRADQQVIEAYLGEDGDE